MNLQYITDEMFEEARKRLGAPDDSGLDGEYRKWYRMSIYEWARRIGSGEYDPEKAVTVTIC